MRKILSHRNIDISDRAVGIDISDRSIRFVELNREKGLLTVTATGEVELEPDVVVHGRIKNEQKLQIAVRKVFNEAKPSKVTPRHIVVGLPEGQTYTHTFTLKKSAEGTQESLTKKEVQSYIPLPYEEVLWASKVLYENRETVEILLIATVREVAEEWQIFFDSLEMSVDLFDIEQLAVYRAIFNEPLTTPICMIDLGALTSHIAIFDLQGLRYAYTAKISGDQITQNLSQKIGKTFGEAEVLKKEVGLSGEDPLVTESIKSSLYPVLDDIVKTICYFEKRMGTKIEELVLVGGASLMHNLVEVVEERCKLKTRLGAQSVVSPKISARFTESVGLAYRIMDKKWEKRDPAFLPLDLTQKIEKEKEPELAALMGDDIGAERASAAEKNELTSDSSGEGNTSDAALKRQKSMLLVVLILGILLIPASFWYKAREDASKEAARKAQIERLDARSSQKAAVSTSTPSEPAGAPDASREAEGITESVANASQNAEETAATASSTGEGTPAATEAEDAASKLRKLSQMLMQQQGTTTGTSSEPGDTPTP